LIIKNRKGSHYEASVLACVVLPCVLVADVFLQGKAKEQSAPHSGGGYEPRRMRILGKELNPTFGLAVATQITGMAKPEKLKIGK
jgi:hypothetical protein